MPATFQTLDAARRFVDYVANTGDQSTLNTLLWLMESIAKDLEPVEKKRRADSVGMPASHLVSS